MTAKIKGPNRLSEPVLAIACLCASTYLLAHTVNALVADALAVQTVAVMSNEREQDVKPDRQTARETSQGLARNILTSGLFPIPAPAQSASVTLSGASPPPPLNASAK